MENMNNFSEIIVEGVKNVQMDASEKDEDYLEVAIPKFSKQLSMDNDDLELEVNDNDDINEDSSIDELWELDDSFIPEQRKKMTKKKTEKSKRKKFEKLKDAKKKELIKLITNGDVHKLMMLLYDLIDLTKHREKVHKKMCELINKKVDDHCNTLLHIAALKEQTSIITFLLIYDANPCLKNKYQQTAYTCTQSEKVRDVLKLFARNNPDKFDYNSAKIPIDPDTYEKIVDMKKAMRKIMREKEKEQESKKKEEKKALAAKRRIMQSGKVTGRCILCEDEIVEKVKVEYNMQNIFCTTQCLKVHRMKNPLVWS